MLLTVKNDGKFNEYFSQKESSSLETVSSSDFKSLERHLFQVQSDIGDLKGLLQGQVRQIADELSTFRAAFDIVRATSHTSGNPSQSRQSEFPVGYVPPYLPPVLNQNMSKFSYNQNKFSSFPQFSSGCMLPP